MNEAELEVKLGISFSDKKLLVQALTHPSFLFGKENCESGHNARLEFLGDSVLNFLVAEHIFSSCPDMRESWLSIIRSQLIRTTALAEVGEIFELKLYLNHTDVEMKYEKGTTFAERRSRLMAGTLEAIIGAFYIDAGLEAVRGLLSKILFPRLEEAVATTHQLINPKSLLNRKAQELLGIVPEYKLIKQNGRTRKTSTQEGVTVQVFFGDNKISESWAKNSKWAYKQAAHAALQKQGWI